MEVISRFLVLTMMPLPPLPPNHHRLADAQALINTLASAHLRRLAQLGDIRLFHRHTTLLHEGTPGEDLVIILEGRLRVFSNSGVPGPAKSPMAFAGPAMWWER